MVGYKMIDSQRGTQHQVGYNRLVSNTSQVKLSFI